MSKTHQLVSIRFSHYNEKARWVMDYYRVPYEEYAYMPMFHMLPVFCTIGLKGNKDKISSPFSTPVLVVPNTNQGVICDSSLICQYVCKTFAPTQQLPCLYNTSNNCNDISVNDEILQFENYVHDELGPFTRRCAYYYLLQDKQAVSEFGFQNVDYLQAKLWQWTCPIISQLMKKGLKINKEMAQVAIQKIDACFEKVGQMLGSDKQYLFGNQFTMADLSFACMAAPILLVSMEDGYGAYMPPKEKIPQELLDMIMRWRESKAGQYALRIFATERRANQRVIPCSTKNSAIVWIVIALFIALMLFLIYMRWVA